MDDKTLLTAAERYRTPSYLFDLDILSRRLKRMKELLGNHRTLCYAMKANPFLVKPLSELVGRFEVCSPGEFRICERSQIAMERIVLSGVNKEYDEISRVVELYGNQCIFTIESLEHLRILDRCSSEHQKSLTVLLRLSSQNQFGMDEETICRIIQKREQYPNLKWRGLQYYSGTQKRKSAVIQKELQHLDALCSRLEDDYGFTVAELEYGPGFAVSYFQNEAEIDDDALLSEFSRMLDSLNFQGHISLEMGRYMTACCGYYLTRAVDLKTNYGEHYCIIDGGINHINYYGQMMAMKIPHFRHFGNNKTGDTLKWNICGSLCTVSDVLIKQLPLQNLQAGDILVFERLGAYSVTEGIYLFLSRDLPAVLFYSAETGLEQIRDNQPTDTINSI